MYLHISTKSSICSLLFCKLQLAVSSSKGLSFAKMNQGEPIRGKLQKHQKSL